MKTVDVTPHWPGLLRWLVRYAQDLLSYEAATRDVPDIDGAAITGGEDTEMYVYSGGALYRFDQGRLFPSKEFTWEELRERAYCYTEASPQYRTFVGGEEVLD